MKRSVKPRNQNPPREARNTSRGRKTTALRTRSGKDASRAGPSAFTSPRGSARSAKAAASALEVIDRLIEMLAPEIGPEGVRDPELRVRELPEQEIRDAEFAAGADQEIRIRQPVRVEHPREELLVDGGGRHPVPARLLDDAAHRVHDLRASAVRERQDQDQPVVSRQEGARLLEDPAAPLGQEVHASDR